MSVSPFHPNSLRERSSGLVTRCDLPSMSSGMTMSLSSRNLILLMVAENMKTLVTMVRRAVLSLFMTINRVVDKEMYLVRLDLFWDDNVTIIPDFDLVDVKRQVKKLFKLYQSRVHTTVWNTLKVTYC
jgi:hypothetical protein